MNNISRSALVPYSNQQMFDLINDVDDYQHFLPWCGDSKVIKDTDNIRLASITIAYKGVHKTFTTRNTLSPHNKIELEMVDGPFSALKGCWQFQALDKDACKVLLELEFGFSNRLVAAVIEPVFKIIANTMLDSFVKRAEDKFRP